MISFLHAALFVVLSSFRPTSVMSLLHASFHRRFGRPLHIFPGMSTSNILLTMCSSFILLTWPYHFSRFSVIFLDACTTLAVPLTCSFRIVSLLVTPNIHLSILISFTSRRASCPIVVAQVSAPYNRAGLTTVLYCISSSFPMLHSLSVKYLLSCLLSPPRLNRDTENDALFVVISLGSPALFLGHYPVQSLYYNNFKEYS